MHLRFWGSRVARRQCRKHKPFLNKPFYLVFGDFRCACQNQIESIGKVQGHIGIQQLVGNKTSAFDSQENAAPILSHPPLRQSRDRDMILSKGAALWKGHSKPKNRPICGRARELGRALGDSPELSQLCREAYQEYRRGGISSAAYNAIYTVCLEYAQPR